MAMIRFFGVWAIPLALTLMVMLVCAYAQDVHHHAGMSPDVDQFYSTWRVPNLGSERVSSCCNRSDCAPAEIKVREGKWYGRRSVDVDWHFIPEALLESNQGDPRESPDSGSHICVMSGRVICAVFGSGQ
jgi:hypothetical protein